MQGEEERRPWPWERDVTRPWTRLSDISHSNSFFSNVWFLEGYEASANIYLIEGDYISLVDTGNDFTAFLELSDIFPLENVKKIVLTHCHSDHTLGLVEFIRIYGIELDVITHKSMCEPLRDRLRHLGGGRVTGVVDGDTLELGGSELKVIHTPGHTMDSICLYHEPTKTLFSGDTVLPYYLPSPDEKLGGNLQSFVQSVKGLMSLEAENLLPGHFIPVFGEGKEVIDSTYKGVIRSITSGKPSWYEKATTLIQFGLFDEAIAYFDGILSEAKEEDVLVSVLGLKGSCYAEMGKHENALECFDKVLEIRESDKAWFSKGSSFLELMRYEDALRCFEEALRINPDHKDAASSKGFALLVLGRDEEAMQIDEFKRRLEEIKKSGGGGRG